MSYSLQVRSVSGKWVAARYTGPSHSHLETAISAACGLDQDGIFPADVRIIDDKRVVVVTAKSWLEQWRVAGMKDFRYEI